MKIKKRIACLIAACLLAISAACTGSGNKPATETISRYIESDITPPIEGQFYSFLTPEGVIACYSQGLGEFYESSDGGNSWSQKPGPGANSDRFAGVIAAALIGSDKLIAFHPSEGMLIIDPDGQAEHFPIEAMDEALAKGEWVMVSFLAAPTENRLVVAYTIGGFMQQVQSAAPVAGGSTQTSISAASGSGQSSGGSEGPGEPQRQQMQAPVDMDSKAGIYDLSSGALICDLSTGELVSNMFPDFMTGAASDGEYIYLLGASGNIYAYGITDGIQESKWNIGEDGSQRGAGAIGMFNRQTNSLVYSNGGLYAATQNGDIVYTGRGIDTKKAIQSESYSTGIPQNSVSALFASGEAIIVSMSSQNSNRLYRYEWDENAIVDKSKILTVWSLEENAFVRAAIAELRKSSPEAIIRYETALGEASAQMASDAIKALNTRLLSGQGPDVIVLDGLSLSSYEGKGLLADLSSLVGTSGVYDSLLSPFKRDGKLYCMPMQFLMPMFVGSEGTLGRAEDLDSLIGIVESGNSKPPAPEPGTPFSGIASQDRPELYFNTFDELIGLLWMASSPSIIAENAIDSDALAKYLEAVKAISTKYALAEPLTEFGEMRIGFSDGGNVQMVPGSLMRYISQQSNYAAFRAGNLQLLHMVMDRDGSDASLFPGLSKGAWEPSTIVGISSDAENKEFAAQLINSMLSTQVQEIAYGIGLPVTKDAIASQIALINERMAGAGRNSFSIDADGLISQLKEPSIADAVLFDMIRPTIQKCCEGTLSVPEAVKELEQNAKNYLAERS
ncbi:MAG: ABC transporter substrate-binding protein [Eubacteriaceae bacterium]|nr:ABC transporter substrate-binding protein [Eubacteriaceae bacterium]